MKHLTSIGLICLLGVVLLTTASAATSLKTGLKVFVIPKNLGNPYFTTADSVKSGGALKALKELKESGTETSGTQAPAASQIPAIQAAITKGANALIVSATDASALCPTLKQAMAKKIAVVTYDSDGPVCRNGFMNQADWKAIGTSEVDLLAKQMGKSGEFAIVSAAASATNQNAWIGYMKQQVKKYPNMKLVSVVYGNDDPTVSTQVTQGLLQQFPNLKGIISPTTVGIAAAAAILDTPQYRGKIKLTGLGTPNSLRKYVKDVSIDLNAGEVHVLVGENGAGKSTLVKILGGVHLPDSGRLRINGHEVVLQGPAAARDAGVAIIYQEPIMFPDLSVAENIFIGRQPLRAGRRINVNAMHSQAAGIFERLGVPLDPGRIARGLSIAEQQIVAIAKALTLDARASARDEPTAALSAAEVER